MKIAIQGHPTRGKEIIQILRSLGATSYGTYDTCSHPEWYWYINKNREITCDPKRSMCGYKLYTLEEFEKEFPFKIGDKVTIVGLPDFPKIITQMMWDCDKILYSFEGLNNTWFGAKSLRKFEMKEERNITLTLDKAKEWYKKGGELKEIALQAFTEEELNSLPRSWKEFCEKYPIKRGECILEAKDRITVAPCNFADNRMFRNWIPSKESAEAHLAMIQLEQLRNCWRQGWEPDWNNPQQPKYYVTYYQGKFKISTLYETRRFLSFPTIKMAEEFLRCFRDLIEKAGDLI